MNWPIATLVTILPLLLCPAASYSINYVQLTQGTNETITDVTVRKLLESLRRVLNPVQEVPDEGYSTNSSDSVFNVHINNTKITDLTDYSVDVAKADMDKLKFQMGMTFKSVNAEGIYDLAVDNDIVKLDGSGPFEVNIAGLQILVNVTLKLTSNATLEIDDVTSDFLFQHIQVNFSHLNHDEQLSDYLNHLINQFIDESVVAMKPMLEDIVRQRAIPLGNFVVMGKTVQDFVEFINSLI